MLVFENPAVPVAAAPVPGLIAAPRALFGRSYVERWEKGLHAERRVRCLRAAGLSVTTRTERSNKKLWNELGADRVTVEMTVVEYVLPRAFEAPPAITMPRVAA